MGRFLGYLYVVGATLGTASMALPQPPNTSVVGLFALFGLAYAIGGVLLFARDRLPAWALPLALGCASLIVTAGMLLTDERTGVYAMFYVWIGLTAFFFFGWRQALAQILLVALAYGAALLVERPAGAEEQWLITLGTVVVAGLLVGLLRLRVERLIASLSDAARTDPLTGLRNRRGFQEAMEIELERASRRNRVVSLVTIDLDNFKEVNDRFGHPAGDRALQRFCELMQSTVRRMDTAGRLGGEEFAIVIPESEGHDAFLVAERLRRKVRETFEDELPGLTASFGIATFPENGTTAEALLHAADRALYAAKELGRDRSVLYSPEVVAGLFSSAARRESAAEGYLSAVLVLAEGVGMREAGTAEHSQAVGRWALLIARRLGLSPEAAERVRLAGILHDVGKIGVPDAILQKPGPLDYQEWVEMRKHSDLGARILARANLDDVSSWVFALHERPDGLGYPRGLSAERIPLESKILAVADAYAAMTSDRSYRAAMSPADAEKEVLRCVGTQFDEGVVEALLQVVESEEGPTPHAEPAPEVSERQSAART